MFDTGEHGVGGRAATRDASDGSLRAEWLPPNLLAEDGAPPQGLVFDHAAQAFTATDPAFAAQTRAWEAAGVVRRWDGPVGMLHPGGHWKPLPDDAPPLWVPTRGMRALAEHMAHEVRVRNRSIGSGSGCDKGHGGEQHAGGRPIHVA